jgi:hypothetical protein
MSCNCLGNTFINKDGQEEALTELMCVEIISKIPDCCDYFGQECLSVLYFDTTAVSYEGCYSCPSENNDCCNKIQNLANSLNPSIEIDCCSNFDAYCQHAYDILKNIPSSSCYITNDIEQYYINNYFGSTGSCGSTFGKASSCIEEIQCSDTLDPECITKLQSKLLLSGSDCSCACTENATSSGCMEYVIYRNSKCCNSWDSECDEILQQLTNTPGTPCFLQQPEAKNYLIGKSIPYTSATESKLISEYNNPVLGLGLGGPIAIECCCSSPDNPIYRTSAAQCCEACDDACAGCGGPDPIFVDTYVFVDCNIGCIVDGQVEEGNEVTLNECQAAFICAEDYQFVSCDQGCISIGLVPSGSEQSEAACLAANICVDSFFCDGSNCESIKVLQGTEQGPEICTTCTPQTVTSFLCQGTGYDRQCTAVQVPFGTPVQTLEQCQSSCTCSNFTCDSFTGNCVATSTVYCPSATSPEECEADGCDPPATCPNYICNQKTGSCEFVGFVNCDFATDQATCELNCNPALCDHYVCDPQTGNCFSVSQIPCADAQDQATCQQNCVKDGGGGGCPPTVCAVCDVNCGYTSYSGNAEVFAAFWSSPWAQTQPDPDCCSGPTIPPIACPDGSVRSACVQLAESYVSYTRFTKKKYVVEKDSNGVYTNRKITDEELDEYLNKRIRVPIAYTQGHCGGKCSRGGDPCDDFNNYLALSNDLNLNQACVTNAPFNISNCYTTFYNDSGVKLNITDTIVKDIAVAFNRTFSSGTAKSKQIDFVEAGIVSDETSYIETPQARPISSGDTCTSVTEFDNLKCENMSYYYGAENPPEGVIAFFNYPERQDTFNDDCCKFLATCREEVTNICAGSYNADCEKRMSDVCLERASRFCVTSGCDAAPEGSRNRQDFVYYLQGVSAGNNCVVAGDDECSDLGDNKCFTYKKLDALDIDFIDTFGDPNRLIDNGSFIQENRSPAQYTGTCFNNSGSAQNSCIKVLQTLADNFSSSQNTQELLNYILRTTGLIDGFSTAFFKKCLCSYMDPHSRTDVYANFNNYPIDLYSGYYSNEFSTCRNYNSIERFNELAEEDGLNFRYALRGYQTADIQYSCGDDDYINIPFDGFERKSQYAIVGHQNGFIQPITLNPCLPCKGFTNFPVGEDTEDTLGQGAFSDFIVENDGKLSIVAYSPYVNYGNTSIGEIIARMTLADQLKQGTIFYQTSCEFMMTLLCSGIEVLHIAEIPNFKYFPGEVWNNVPGITLPKDRSERLGGIYDLSLSENEGRFPYQKMGQILGYGIIGGGIGVLGNHYGPNTGQNDQDNKITGELSSGMNPRFNNSFGIIRVHKAASLSGLSVTGCPLQFDALNTSNQRVNTPCNLPNNIVMGGMCWIGPVITTEVWNEMKVLPDNVYSDYDTFVEWALDNEELIENGTFDATFFANLDTALAVLNYTVNNIPAEEVVYTRKDTNGTRIYTLNDLLLGAKQISNTSNNPGGCLEVPEEPVFGNNVFGTNGNCLETVAGIVGGNSLISFMQTVYSFTSCASTSYPANDPTTISSQCKTEMVDFINGISPGCIDINELNSILTAIKDYNSNPCLFGYNNKTYRQMRV